jgi:hypothetical protein
MESTFTKPFANTKKPNNVLVALFGNETTAIAFDQWYDTRNAKTYLFNPSDVTLEPKNNY